MDIQTTTRVTTTKRVSVALSSDQVAEILSKHLGFPVTAELSASSEWSDDFITLQYEEVETTEK